MSSPTARRAPWHLWAVAGVSTLWNAMGAFDYTMTQMRADWYMAQFTPEQLDYFYGFPVWANTAWAVAVWVSLLGSLALLMRSSWAVPLFAIAFLAMVGTAIYNFGLSDGMAVMGEGIALWAFTIAIWVAAALLLVYARRMRLAGVLR